MKVFVNLPEGTTRESFFPLNVKEKLENSYKVIWNETGKNLTEDELCEYLKDIDICFTGWGSVEFSERALKNAEKLKVIAHTGGTVAALTKDNVYDRGIRVISGNDLYARSVAEGTICYILAALRRIPQFCEQMSRDGWHLPDWYSEGLIGQKVGLVGFGAVARHTARLLSAFDAEIFICADHVSEEEAASYGAKKATAEEVFSQCKIISLHLARTPETFHIIGRELLSMLKPDSLLVNTARGSIIDEQTMAEMLKDGKFRAVLDVYEKEPLPADSPLRGLENVILIPHMAGPTVDRRPFITEALIDALPDVLSGKETYLDISREAMHRMTI